MVPLLVIVPMVPLLLMALVKAVDMRAPVRLLMRPMKPRLPLLLMALLVGRNGAAIADRADAAAGVVDSATAAVQNTAREIADKGNSAAVQNIGIAGTASGDGATVGQGADCRCC